MKWGCEWLTCLLQIPSPTHELVTANHAEKMAYTLEFPEVSGGVGHRHLVLNSEVWVKFEWAGLTFSALMAQCSEIHADEASRKYSMSPCPVRYLGLTLGTQLFVSGVSAM